MGSLIQTLEQKMGPKLFKASKVVLGAVVGGTLGYTYYALVGCSSGGCPITSNPMVATAWGGLIGGFSLSGL
jgi:hypothetical protein